MSANSFSLEGKVALVTGGGRGIGGGIAKALATAGADVVIADMMMETAQETAAEIEKMGRRSAAIQVDVRSEDSVRAMIDSVVKGFGKLDIAANNAGVVSNGGIEEVSEIDWDLNLDVNLKGVFLCCKHEVGVMRKNGFGRIINTSSIAGKIGFPGLTPYSASKFGVIGLTNALAKEVARDGITVNALCPGIVGTGMWRGDKGMAKLWANPDESEEDSWARHQDALLPQGEAQTPEDMGQMVVYMASAPHLTGQALAVDGGFSL